MSFIDFLVENHSDDQLNEAQKLWLQNNNITEYKFKILYPDVSRITILNGSIELSQLDPNIHITVTKAVHITHNFDNIPFDEVRFDTYAYFDGFIPSEQDIKKVKLSFYLIHNLNDVSFINKFDISSCCGFFLNCTVNFAPDKVMKSVNYNIINSNVQNFKVSAKRVICTITKSDVNNLSITANGMLTLISTNLSKAKVNFENGAIDLDHECVYSDLSWIDCKQLSKLFVNKNDLVSVGLKHDVTFTEQCNMYITNIDNLKGIENITINEGARNLNFSLYNVKRGFEYLVISDKKVFDNFVTHKRQAYRDMMQIIRKYVDEDEDKYLRNFQGAKYELHVKGFSEYMDK